MVQMPKLNRLPGVNFYVSVRSYRTSKMFKILVMCQTLRTQNGIDRYAIEID